MAVLKRAISQHFRPQGAGSAVGGRDVFTSDVSVSMQRPRGRNSRPGAAPMRGK